MAKSLTHIYHIGGMSDGRCASAVIKKLSGVHGVNSVTIDLIRKEARVMSSMQIAANDLRCAFSGTHFSICEPGDKIKLI